MESLPSAIPDLPAATTYSTLSSPTAAKRAANPVSGIESGVRTPQHSNDVIRSEEHTSELQSQSNLVCRLLLEKKNSGEASAAARRHAGIATCPDSGTTRSDRRDRCSGAPRTKQCDPPPVSELADQTPLHAGRR